jgi:hypothetical protein
MVKRIVAMVVAVASGLVCCALDRAKAGGPDAPTFLLFSGVDFWRYGEFLYGGAQWSPGGVDADGFTLKMLLNGGGYIYNSGTLNASVNGTTLAAAVLPGWRFSRDGLIVKVFAGPVVQDYQLAPYDPGSRLHGLFAGGEFATDIWYQPTPNIMAALSGTVASIGPTGSLRAAFGFRVFDKAFVGPEAQQLWCGNFQEVQLGAHLTALHVGPMEWSAGSGWAATSDRRAGPYLRFGVNTRY